MAALAGLIDSALPDSRDELRRKNDELRASRARVVAAADAERRRIERDLHDGAQQQLTCLSVQLLMAAKLAGHDPDLASLLEQLGGEVRDTARELRSLAHGIYPPLLRANGLADALFAAASHCPLPTRVQAGSLGRYPADVEAAVYFCCLEAMQNACKHAGERATIRLRVREEPGTLTFEVIDDGAGFDAVGCGLVRVPQHGRPARRVRRPPAGGLGPGPGNPDHRHGPGGHRLAARASAASAPIFCPAMCARRCGQLRLGRSRDVSMW